MILIDMELPASCEECPCCQPDAHYMQFSCGIENTDVEDYETGEMPTERPDWCPLREVSAEKVEKALKEAGKKMSTAALPHTYYKAVSVKKAIEIVREIL